MTEPACKTRIERYKDGTVTHSGRFNGGGRTDEWTTYDEEGKY